MSFHFVARRGRIDPGYVNVRSIPATLHDPSAFDALDDIGTITTVDIGCKQNILPTHPQLELLRDKVAMIGYRNLKIRIGAEPISSLCSLLSTFVDAFANNRYLRLDISGSRLNFYGDHLWAPCITNFIQHTPTLFLLDLGFLNSMPENLKDAIISHRNLRELRLGHNRHPDTNHHDLHCAVAHVIARGNLTCLRVRLNVVDTLPECYEEALKGGGSTIEILDIGLEPQSSSFRLGWLTAGHNEVNELTQKLQRQMSGILCSHLSVKHIVQSNHTLHEFVREERIDNAILRMAVDINNNYDNDYNSGDDLEMWKIRSKCFLCSKAMEEWMISFGKHNMDDEETNVKWLNKKLHVIQWLTKPDGFSEGLSFNWTYKFLKLHHSHLLSYCPQSS